MLSVLKKLPEMTSRTRVGSGFNGHETVVACVKVTVALIAVTKAEFLNVRLDVPPLNPVFEFA